MSSRRSAPADRPSPYQGTWGGELRLRTLSRVRQAMSEAVGLLPVAESAAEAILEIMSAASVSILLMDEGFYSDLLNVGTLPPGEERFPVNSRYPTSQYPIATERLLDGKGYFSGSAVDEILTEFRHRWPQVSVGSIMGVPIVALGSVHGEVFLIRDEQTPPFNREDMELVADLATMLGARLPALVANYGLSSAELQMPGLASHLNDLLGNGGAGHR